MTNFQAKAHECKPKEVHAQVEHEVHEWIQSQRPRKVPSSEVREKAREVYRQHGRLQIECSYGWYRRFQARMHNKGNVTSTKLHEEEDELVLTWLIQIYDNNQLVSYKDLQNYAQTAFREIKPDFKASAGWALRFLKRNHIIINWNYGVYTNQLPSTLECQVGQCKNQVRLLLNQFQENCVGCMDEIPLSFTNPTTSRLGLNKVEKDTEDFELDDSNKISRLKKLSVKNCDATLILGMLANGTILPPMVIVKGQLPSSINQVYNTPQSSVVTYYSTTTEPCVTSMERWIDLVWSKAVTSPALIIMDSYEIHSQLKNNFQAYNTQCFQIPLGCSLKLHPLNAFAKSAFLKNLDKLWLDYLQPNDNAEPDSFEKIKLPTTTDVVEWVQKSYEHILNQKDELSKSFSLVFDGK